MGEHADQNPMRDLQALIGSVTVAWNDVSYMLFLVFQPLSGMPKDPAGAVYFSIPNERTQRQVIRSLARTVLAEDERLLGSLNETLKRIDNLAKTRNEATHTAWALQIRIPPDDPGTPKIVRQRRANRPINDGFTDRFQRLAQKLSSTYFDLVKIRQAIIAKNR